LIKRKKVITYLLFTACLLCGVILLTSSTEVPKTVNSQQQIDSLVYKIIQQNEAQLNRIRRSSVEADSNFARTLSYLYVPPSFSKTTFHHTLQKNILPFNMQVPAKVTLPENNMDIHLVYEGTIWHTVQLITDLSETD